jgi:hypothetical protein
MRLGGPQSRSGRCGEKNSLLMLGIEALFLGSQCHNLDTILTELPRLCRWEVCVYLSRWISTQMPSVTFRKKLLFMARSCEPQAQTPSRRTTFIGHPALDIMWVWAPHNCTRQILLEWQIEVRWGRHVARMGQKRSACRFLIGKPKGTRPLGRRRGRWEDNIKMDLREVGWRCGFIWQRLGTSGGLLWTR